MINIEKQNLRENLHKISKLERSQVFKGPLPNTRQDIAVLPRLGIIGSNYKKKGVALIGINPGSGEGRPEEVFTDRDTSLKKAFRNFQLKGDLPTFQILNQTELNDMQYWPLDWAIQGALQRLNLQLEDIAFTNVIPFSTKNSARIRESEWRDAVHKYLSKWLSSVEPSLVIWLGKSAYDKALKYINNPEFKSYVVDRRRNWTLEERFRDLDSMLVEDT